MRVPFIKVRECSAVVFNSSVMAWTIAHQAHLSMGFSRQENWNGLPFPSPEDLPDPGTEVLPPALADGFFSSEPPGKPLKKDTQ